MQLRQREEGGIDYAFHDQNQDDPYSVSGAWLGVGDRGVARGQVWKDELNLRGDVSAAPTQEEQRKLGGVCMNGAGYVPLLTGFDFAHSQKDVQVRRLAAICETKTMTQCRGSFGWHSAHEDRCGAGEASRRALQTSYQQAWEEAERLDTDDIEAFFDTSRSYGGKSAIADWIYVPLSAIDECRFVYGRDTRAIADFSNGRPMAIQGFDYRFLDTDHHVLEVGLTPGSAAPQARFRDNNLDDPFEFRVQLCALSNSTSRPLPGVSETLRRPVAANKPLAVFTEPQGWGGLRFDGVNGGVSGVRGEATAAAVLGGEPLLSSFFLGFQNGDHKIKALGVEPIDDRAIRFVFSDGNGDDPFEARASYLRAVGATLKTLSFRSTDEFGAPAHSCSDLVSCEWRVGEDHGVPASYVPILSSLVFERQATDANIGRLTAGWADRVDNGQGRFAAGMTEEGGWDWRHTESQTDRGASAPSFRGSAVLVPAEKIEKCDSKYLTWHGEPGSDHSLPYDSVPIEPNKRFVLQRVSFGFGPGQDHHLQQIGVEYLPHGELRVHFKDDNRDDPYGWDVSYCFLR